ncbi:encapsulin, partial [Mycolicibacterium nivoides]
CKSLSLEFPSPYAHPRSCEPTGAFTPTFGRDRAPAIDGAFVLSTRGGDFDLQLGTDVSIGYLSHDAESVQLYLQETLTFLAYTAEASVALTA